MSKPRITLQRQLFGIDKLRCNIRFLTLHAVLDTDVHDPNKIITIILIAVLSDLK
jgi:hypothetical protein